jgi:hypothetical protein
MNTLSKMSFLMSKQAVVPATRACALIQHNYYCVCVCMCVYIYIRLSIYPTLLLPNGAF